MINRTLTVVYAFALQITVSGIIGLQDAQE